MKSLSHVRLFATPWTAAYQALPSMGFSRQEYWSGLPFPSPGDLPNPGIEPRSPALQAVTFLWATREAQLINSITQKVTFNFQLCCGFSNTDFSLKDVNSWSWSPLRQDYIINGLPSLSNFFISVSLFYSVELLSAIQQSGSDTCVHTLLPSGASLPPHLIPWGHLRAPSWGPWATWSFPRDRVYMSLRLSQSIPPSSSSVSTWPLSTCREPALQTGSSVPLVPINAIYTH